MKQESGASRGCNKYEVYEGSEMRGGGVRARVMRQYERAPPACLGFDIPTENICSSDKFSYIGAIQLKFCPILCSARLVRRSIGEGGRCKAKPVVLGIVDRVEPLEKWYSIDKVHT